MQGQLCHCYIATRPTRERSSALLQQIRSKVPLRHELRYSNSICCYEREDFWGREFYWIRNDKRRRLLDLG
jgi:hypothetical protein